MKLQYVINIARSASAGVIAFALFANCASAQESATDESAVKTKKITQAQRIENDRRLREAAPDIEARRERIEQELASLNVPADHWAREWAGTYYVGDGLGMNVGIVVAPANGIAYTWHGCMGLYDGDYGAIEDTFDDDGDGKADGLRIKWTLDLDSQYDFNSAKYYFVRWPGPDGAVGRRYLVPESKLIDMVNHYNQGTYARDGMYSAPLKYDATSGQGPRQRKPVIGAPQLPAKWAKLLHADPVDATITSAVIEQPRHVTGTVNVTTGRFELDKGAADGLYLGMEIWNRNAGADAGVLTIVKLDEHSAEADFRAFHSEGKKIALPAVGESIRVIGGADANVPECVADDNAVDE